MKGRVVVSERWKLREKRKCRRADEIVGARNNIGNAGNAASKFGRQNPAVGAEAKRAVLLDNDRAGVCRGDGAAEGNAGRCRTRLLHDAGNWRERQGGAKRHRGNKNAARLSRKRQAAAGKTLFRDIAVQFHSCLRLPSGLIDEALFCTWSLTSQNDIRPVLAGWKRSAQFLRLEVNLQIGFAAFELYPVFTWR